MKGGNEFSVKELRPDAVEWLTKLHQTMIIKEYGKGSVRNYCREMKLLFKYFNHKAVTDIRQADIEQYLQYIKEVHKVGRAKCRSVAQSCSFFFKRILPVAYIVPSNLYPKKQFILPNIMSEEEVIKLFAAPLTLKEYCVIGLLYGSGLRISEACNLRLQDIESQNKRLKVYQGKGAKDRYTLLPDKLLQQLRIFYLEERRPKEYLFTSKQTKQAIHVRSMQVIVNSAMAKAGFKDKPFTAHTLRHSFATHLLNMGTNLHVIKTLLGHSKLETTMVYLHLQKHTQLGIVSPLEVVVHGGAVAK
ncbi:MAG TPA: tyrosine-type recombinase/integrase [Hanamia sp.]